MGTIYKDTASRGQRNGCTRYIDRWVAEITIQRKRYRKRSSDYKVVLQWLNEMEAQRQQQRDANAKMSEQIQKKRTQKSVTTYQYNLARRRNKGELIPVEGADDYLIDRNTLECYSMKSACRIKYKGNEDAPHYQVHFDDGHRRYVSACRVVYAHDHGIPVSKLPNSYAFRRDEHGNIVVDTLSHNMNKGIVRVKAEYRKRYIDRMTEELNELRACYETGDTSDVMRYIMMHRELFCWEFLSWVKTSHTTARDMLVAALPRVEAHLLRPDTTVTNLTRLVVGTMRNIYLERKKEIRYNDDTNHADWDTGTGACPC